MRVAVEVGVTACRAVPVGEDVGECVGEAAIVATLVAVKVGVGVLVEMLPGALSNSMHCAGPRRNVRIEMVRFFTFFVREEIFAKDLAGRRRSDARLARAAFEAARLARMSRLVRVVSSCLKVPFTSRPKLDVFAVRSTWQPKLRVIPMKRGSG